MELKRNGKAVKKLASMTTFSIKQKGGAVFIEGFANKATVDRGSEIIDPKAWELDNFKNNPIILFNHGFDMLGGTPVGRATQVKPTEEGLYLKVRLSNSEAPGIKMVRDLVEERILQAFSVGFDPKETNKETVGEGKDQKEVTRITKAELFEVSIVGVPMNQDSLFTVSEKSLATKSLYEIKKDVLAQKGADYAAELHEKIHALEEAGQEKSEIIEMLAEASSLSVDEVKDILAGNSEPSDDFKAAAAAAFKPDEEDEEDKEEDKGNKPEDEDEEEDEEAKSDKGDEDKAGKEDEEDEGEGDSEKAGEGQAEDRKEGEGEVAKSDEQQIKQDFQECVSGKVPGLIADGKEQDEAVAIAISECQDSGKCTLSPESKLAAFDACFAAVDKFKESGEWDFATLTTTDIILASDVKQVDQPGVDPSTVEIETSKSEDDFGSPFLEQQKQTNVMLGTLIGEIQKLNAGIAGLNQKTDISSEDTSSKDGDESTDSGTISEDAKAEAEKALDSLSKRVKSLGY